MVIINDLRVPFNTLMSKNKMWARTRTGRVFIPKEVKDLRDRYSLLIKKSINPDFWKEFSFKLVSKKKTWEDGKIPKITLSLTVVRNDFKSDPINYLDAFADTLKEIIGIDDRYFQCKVDWYYDKENGPYFSLSADGELIKL